MECITADEFIADISDYDLVPALSFFLANLPEESWGKGMTNLFNSKTWKMLT